VNLRTCLRLRLVRVGREQSRLLDISFASIVLTIVILLYEDTCMSSDYRC
jgi:hypothetical protein